MDEFELIKRCFAPLSRGFAGSLDLSDDAALVDVPAGQQLVVTKDAISEGVHFLGQEDAALIARKLLRVNLSDLAAMGAAPLAYLLAILLPEATQPAWVMRFAEGLKQDQAEFGIALIGGDTVAAKGPLACSLTALGLLPRGEALRRAGACVGDAVYVSGSLGDSALGLQLLQRSIEPPAEHAAQQFLQQRYFLPQPRLALGQALRGHATSCIDISDGLLQDMQHICDAASVGAVIERPDLPLSAAAKTLLAQDARLWDCIIAGGDDYELLFTAPEALKLDAATPITRIGRIVPGDSVTLLDDAGKPLATPRGYRHF